MFTRQMRDYFQATVEAKLVEVARRKLRVEGIREPTQEQIDCKLIDLIHDMVSDWLERF